MNRYFKFPLTFLLLLLSNNCIFGQSPCSNGTIDNRSNFSLDCTGTLMINGKIDGQSTVNLNSSNGNIVIVDKIDGQSNVTLTARNGSVTVNGKVDGASSLKVVADGDIIIGEKIDGSCNIDFYSENGHIIIKDYVGNPRTTIRYHSKFAPSWGSHCDASPQKY